MGDAREDQESCEHPNRCSSHAHGSSMPPREGVPTTGGRTEGLAHDSDACWRRHSTLARCGHQRWRPLGSRRKCIAGAIGRHVRWPRSTAHWTSTPVVARSSAKRAPAWSDRPARHRPEPRLGQGHRGKGRRTPWLSFAPVVTTCRTRGLSRGARLMTRADLDNCGRGVDIHRIGC